MSVRSVINPLIFPPNYDAVNGLDDFCTNYETLVISSNDELSVFFDSLALSLAFKRYP